MNGCVTHMRAHNLRGASPIGMTLRSLIRVKFKVSNKLERWMKGALEVDEAYPKIRMSDVRLWTNCRSSGDLFFDRSIE